MLDSKIAKPKNAAGTLLSIAIVLVLVIAGIAVYFLKSAEKHFGAADKRLPIPSRLKYAFLLKKNADALNKANFFQDGKERKFFIDQNDTVLDICAKLQTEGFVSNAEAACQLLIYYGRDRNMQPGSYTIASGQNTIEIAKRIGNDIYRDISLRIFAGWRIEEIAYAIGLSPFSFSGADFLEAIKAPSQLYKEKFAFIPEASLEGFILPGLYYFKPDINLADTIFTLLEEFETKVVKSGLDQQIEGQGLTLREGLTMASIIQRETLATEEMPLMASVFYNRLQLGMQLQTDVTVQYALGWDENTKTWWKSRLTWDDLAVDMLYNTYRYYGLPPGPICSPSLDAIQAVAQPEGSDYLFFRAACDQSGRHNFAITYEEHLNNGCD